MTHIGPIFPLLTLLTQISFLDRTPVCWPVAVGSPVLSMPCLAQGIPRMPFHFTLQLADSQFQEPYSWRLEMC